MKLDDNLKCAICFELAERPVTVRMFRLPSEHVYHIRILHTKILYVLPGASGWARLQQLAPEAPALVFQL